MLELENWLNRRKKEHDFPCQKDWDFLETEEQKLPEKDRRKILAIWEKILHILAARQLKK